MPDTYGGQYDPAERLCETGGGGGGGLRNKHVIK